MMISDSLIKRNQQQYENTVIDYINKQNGHFIVLSDDQSFLTLLRLTLGKVLGLQSDIMTAVVDPAQLLRHINEVIAKHPSPIIFMERVMGARDLSFLVQQFKGAFPSVRIIVLTISADRDRLMLLHEVGADNFIAKPVSTNTLVEKMAFTLRPQTKFGQMIDTAKDLVLKKKPDEALELCGKILEIKPNSAAGYLVMGDAYRLKGDIEKARESFEQASQYADLFLEPLRRRAELHAESGDTKKRLLYLQKLDKLSPLNVDRKVDMGEIQLRLGNEDEAEKLFDSALAQVTKEAMRNISTISNKIAAFYSERDPVKAEKFLRKTLEIRGSFLSRTDVNTFNLLGISLRQQGRWKDAVIEYKKALKIAPDDENLYYNIGMAYAEGKDFSEARANMIKALELNSEIIRSNAAVAYNMGLVFVQSESTERGVQCFKAALEVDPGYEPARKALERYAKF